MTNKIPYETIYQAKMGSEEALAAILNHYEPQIVKASIRTVNMPDGSKQRIRADFFLLAMDVGETPRILATSVSLYPSK